MREYHLTGMFCRQFLSKKIFWICLLFVVALAGFTACGKKDNTGLDDIQTEEENKNTEMEKTDEPVVVRDLSQYITKDDYHNEGAVHDPTFFKDGTFYYTFGSHMSLASSTDLWNWDILANGVTDENKLFQGLLGGEAFAWCGKNEEGSYSVWAPDIIYNSKMEKYCMYFSVSGSKNKSSICLAVSDHITGPFTFVGRVLDSGFNVNSVKKTLAGELFGSGAKRRNYFDKNGSYNRDTCPSASDPAVFYDADGQLWMTYGSRAGGIYLLKLNRKTGLAEREGDDSASGRDAYFGTHLLGYGDAACEAPFILYHEDAKYYYLFVSCGTPASDGGYDVREFRSETVTGPYVDSMGQTWTESAEDFSVYGVKVLGNYELPGNAQAYVSGGHSAVVADSDGKILLVHHTRFDDGSEDYELRVRQMFLNEAGWLCANPFNINNLKKEEKLKESGYSTRKLLGTYYLINHGNDVTADISKATAISLQEDNVLEGIENGSWEKIDNTPYANITINHQTYQGVFMKQKDEGGHDVILFTGICDANNQQIWAVKYLELGEEGDRVSGAIDKNES